MMEDIKTVTFGLNSGEVFTYRIDNIIKTKIIRKSYSGYGGSVGLKLQTSSEEYLAFYFYNERGEDRCSVDEEELDNLLLVLRKLLDIGFYDEEELKTYLVTVRDWLCKAYNKKTDKIEEEINERFNDIENMEEETEKTTEEIMGEIDELTNTI